MRIARTSARRSSLYQILKRRNAAFIGLVSSLGAGNTHDEAMLAVDDGSVDGEEVPAEVQIPPLQSACLADSEAGPRKQIDTRVDDPSARCAVRRGDHFPLPSLVNKPVANLKFHRQDAAPVRRCWLALLLWFRSSHRLVSTDPQKM